MAEDEGGKPATVVGGDPKKRKMMAIGIGVAALFVVILMFGKKSSTAATTGTTTNGTSTGNGVTADVAVPSGDVSTSDLMSQFATTTQAGNQALLQQMAGYLKNTNTNMPGGPPQPTGAQTGSSGGFWYTVQQGGAYLTGLAQDAYRLNQGDQWFAPNDAFDASQIAAANPGLDISKQLQAGTQVYIPYLPGSPAPLSNNESYSAPASAYNAGPTGTQYHNVWPSVWTQQSGVNNLTLTQPANVIAPKTA